MKVKTTELTRAALNWAVAKCEGMVPNTPFIASNKEYTFKPSTDWAQGGPIIEREGISVATDDVEPWCGFIEDDEINTLFFSGPTPLIAAMRCYVASKLGDEIEVPNELFREV
jgi:hypothetical protein